MNVLSSPLGKKNTYKSSYDKSLLFPIPRSMHRKEIGVGNELPFKGYDYWNAYEVSWLNSKGKPIVAFAEFYFPCESENIIESKSFKLYLNSFNNTKFESAEIVQETIIRDISDITRAKAEMKLMPLNEVSKKIDLAMNGKNIDDLDIECSEFSINPQILTCSEEMAEETINSDLLKSNCLVTGQPDWASVVIKYKGNKIDHANLLKYIVSFRNHNEFHEQCVERVFMDIMNQCSPENLSVYARYTRRGGLDINPFRTNHADEEVNNIRLIRQ